MADTNVKRLRPEKNMVRIDARSLIEQNMARAARGEPQLHECCVCGQCGVWTDAWSWYGSVRDADAGQVAKFCSQECRAKERGETALVRCRNRSTP